MLEISEKELHQKIGLAEPLMPGDSRIAISEDGLLIGSIRWSGNTIHAEIGQEVKGENNNALVVIQAVYDEDKKKFLVSGEDWRPEASDRFDPLSALNAFRRMGKFIKETNI